MTAVTDNKDAKITSQAPSAGLKPDGLEPVDLFWVNLRPWLAERGYKLRPRYQPGWKGSWLTEGFSGPRNQFEDFRTYIHPWVMDAIRERDGALVMLKQVKKVTEDSRELQMAEFLSQDTFDTDNHNHCVQIYEILDIPGSDDEVLLVMPLLYEVRDKLNFETVGEVVDFFRQILQGLQFMHQQNVAYRDCKLDNILADSAELYNERPHPLLLGKSYDGQKDLKQRYSRTNKPIRYYYIDFGLSMRYSSRNGNVEPSPWGAGIYKVPEFQVPLDTPTDPFPVDIYMLGMMIRHHFLEDMLHDDKVISTRRVNLEWMESLARDMTLDDPVARPKIEEVIERFDVLVKGLGQWKSRAPVNRTKYELSAGQKARHWVMQASRMVRFIPAIPRPPRRPSKAAPK